MTEIRNTYPDPFIMADGTRVETPKQWGERAQELTEMYQKLMYGYIREGEKVTYKIENKEAEVVSFFGNHMMEGSVSLTVYVEKNGRKTEFTVPALIPDETKVKKPEGGWPFIVSMHEIMPYKYALEHGYALIIMNANQIASDNTAREGCFYDIYPYTEKDEDQTGVLAAWGWGASKILDAVYGGAGREFGLNADNSMITGVSRYGKAAAVCGAFDKRFRMVVPSCSGAGGLALYRYVSEGKTYDFSSKGAPAEYTYGKNEPLSCLQSDAERGWFNDSFLQFKDPKDIPLEQYELAALCADPKRFYFVIGSCISEDWVNAPAMWACYKAAERIYDFLGLKDHIVCNIHKEGHAVIEEDMVYMIEYFNRNVYGVSTDMDLAPVKTSVFMEKANYDPMFDAIGEGFVH